MKALLAGINPTVYALPTADYFPNPDVLWCWHHH